MDEQVKVRGGNVIIKQHGAWGGSYFLGFLGAFIYYMNHATTFGNGVIGFLKSLVWPAYLVYHLFTFLKP